MQLQLQTGYRQILNLALPISLAMLVPQINFITNNIFLAGIGERELASAGITGVYYLIFAVVGNGLNNGLQALISRRAGQNQPHEIGRLFLNGVWLALGMALAGIAITYTVAPVILKRVIHNPAIAAQVIDFLLIRIWGLPFLYVYVMRNAFLVGTNQPKYLVWGTLSEAITNIVLDYGLIYGKLGLPNLGFNGAAYASIIAEATGLVVIYVLIFAKGLSRTFKPVNLPVMEWTVIRLILFYSAPLIVQYSVSILTWEYFYILIEHHGERALAVSNTMRNIFGVFGIFAWAFASTANTMVSNVIGQGLQDHVLAVIRRIATLSFCISLVVFALLNAKPEWFLFFYGRGDEFVQYAIPVVRVVSVALLLMSVSTVWLNAVIGTGNTVVNLAIELVTIVVYSIYVYVVLEMNKMSITWGWASELVYWFSMFILSYGYMKSRRWRSATIREGYLRL